MLCNLLPEGSNLKRGFAGWEGSVYTFCAFRWIWVAWRDSTEGRLRPIILDAVHTTLSNCFFSWAEVPPCHPEMEKVSTLCTKVLQKCYIASLATLNVLSCCTKKSIWWAFIVIPTLAYDYLGLPVPKTLKEPTVSTVWPLIISGIRSLFLLLKSTNPQVL